MFDFLEKRMPSRIELEKSEMMEEWYATRYNNHFFGCLNVHYRYAKRENRTYNAPKKQENKVQAEVVEKSTRNDSGTEVTFI